MIKYTPQQERAMDDRGNNIIVSAQAGAGKTQILVNRIINLVIEKTPITNMLIVTFTNKAANEMKDRIKSGIAKKMQESESDLRYLSSQLNDLDEANISTMHAFCIRIIREYFNELDIDPNFVILNEQTLEILKQDSIDEVFDNSYGNEDFIDFLNSYGSFRGHVNAKEMILEVSRFLESQISIDWLKEEVKFSNSEDKKKMVSLYFVDKYREDLEESILLNEKIIDIAKSTSGPEKYIESLENDRDSIKFLIETLKKEDYETFFDQCKNFGINLKNQKTETDLEEEKKKLVKNIRDGYKGKIRSFERPNLDDLNREGELINTIETLTLDYFEKFNEKKKDKNGIDFSDAEHLMLKLLENNVIREELKERYKYIFFDEYQDVNNIQNAIVEKLKNEDNLFFVGDVKQSIYSFRLADPSIFINRYNEYKKGDKKIAIDLTDNFRSRKEVLNFINYIFDDLMTNDFGQIEYRNKENRLEAGRSDFESQDASVELLFIYQENAWTKDLSIKEYEKKYKDIELECVLVGDKIKEEVSKGARYQEFCILARTKNEIKKYEEYFNKIGIPLYSESSDISFERQEIRTFIDILRVIDNDLQDQALIATLLSPFGGFNEQELSIIRINKKNGPFYSACKEYSVEDEIKNKLDIFYNKLEEIRKELPYRPLENFGYYVLDETGFREYLTAFSNGKEMMDNIFSFLDIMSNYEEGAFGGLYGFLRYVDDLIKKDKGDLNAVSSNDEKDNVVKIMTIHKSKGLQFDKVFLVDLDHRFNEKDLRKDILLDDEKGIGLKVSYPELSAKRVSASFDMISDSVRKKNREEEARILYVALTRAIDKLYLVGKIGKSNKDNAIKSIDNSTLKSNNNFLAWIFNILYNKKESKNLLDFDKLPYRGESKELNAKSYIVDEATVYEMIEDLNPLDVTKKEEKLSKEEVEILEYTYPYEDDINKAYKKTVSELSLKNINLDTDLKPWERIDTIVEEKRNLSDRMTPNFLKSEKTFKSNEIGTILHFVFQNISIKHHTLDSINKELDNMVSIDLLSKEERKVVDENLILAFFNSDLGKDVIKNKDSVRREESFTMKYKDYLVDGQIDLFYKKDNETYIIDFKSNSKIDENLYVNQIKMYEKALSNAIGRKVKNSYIYWIRFNEITKY